MSSSLASALAALQFERNFHELLQHKYAKYAPFRIEILNVHSWVHFHCELVGKLTARLIIVDSSAFDCGGLPPSVSSRTVNVYRDQSLNDLLR